MSTHSLGPWKAERTKGWGDNLCIVAQGYTKPIFQTIKPDAYYTDYAPSADGNGVILSDDVAAQNGRYVATPEIREEINLREEANARLVAAAPELLQALICLVEWAENHAAKPDEIPELVNARSVVAKAAS